MKLFIEGQGEFGSALIRKVINHYFPCTHYIFFLNKKCHHFLLNIYWCLICFSLIIAKWWNNYSDEGPHLQKISVEVLSQTCSSSGCERNWSTWSLIHTKLRNHLTMKKLYKLVYVHYNMRLRVKNLMHGRSDEDLYNQIDLNHIFNDNDILDE